MDINGRPNCYDDVMVRMHKGAWFGFYKDRDYDARVAMPHEYQYLVMLPDKEGVTHDRPTKDYLDTELAKAQTEFDAKDYARKRAREYPLIGDQLDMIYHDQVNGTTTFKDAIKAVKDKYPKS